MSTPPPLFNRLALIGVGLIGSSIARAARAQGVVREIVATARTEATRARVAELGIADQVVATAAEAVADADLVIVCIPVGACGAVAQEIGAHLKAGAIVSDVGSVKGSVVKDMRPHLPAAVHFVPAHPVAGTENSGPDSGFAELFANRWCILTPPEDAEPAAVERLAAFWRAFGANVETMSPEHHDLVLAVTSHLPHLIAYTIVGTAEGLSKLMGFEVLQYAGKAFRQFTRIAASDPTMWRDIFITNRNAVLEMLGSFNEDLSTLTRAMRERDRDRLLTQFSHVGAIRRGIVAIGQDTPEDYTETLDFDESRSVYKGLVPAAVSHLPHLIAFAIINTADELSQVTRSEVLQFSAGGFRDFTHIATSDPDTWTKVLINNRTAVIEVLGRFNEDLSKLTRSIRRQDGDALFEFFKRIRQIRRGLVGTTDETSRPDLGPSARSMPLPPLPRPYSD